MSVQQEKWQISYLALTVGFLVLAKVFLFDQCYSFDSNDDANHTFVNLKAARDLLMQGALPALNLYNNFGTPLLGDALTFPFALQSITYWVLPDYLAMTVNRAVIGFFTMVMLSLLLRQFLGLRAALVCALLVFFSPGQFWNLAHHHYQMSLLGLCSILYVQSRHAGLNGATYLLLLWTSYIILFLSVSIQPVLLAIPFLVLFLLLKEGFQAKKAWAINIAALVSAAVATWPHTAIFFENIAGSTRAQWSPYSGILSTTREQVLALFVPPGEWMQYGINGHFSVVTYYSIAYLVFAVIGILVLTRKARAEASLLRLILVLGVIPAVGGYILQFYGQNIPFVRNVDSTRVWWFSNVFLVLAVGKLIDASWRQSLHWFSRAVVGAGALGILIASFSLPELIPEFNGMAPLHVLVMCGTGISLLFVLFSSFAGAGHRQSPRSAQGPEDYTEESKASSAGKGLVIAVLLLAQVPVMMHVMGLNMRSCEKGNHYFNQAQEATFQPRALLSRMEPGYRMASVESPVKGHDLKAIHGGVLGSNARAIVSSQQLMAILAGSRLVTLDDNYFFSPPWQTGKLSRLGIRYLLLNQQDPELERQGWNVIATDDYKGQQFLLYENSSPASLVHFLRDDQPVFVKSYELVPNGIRIRLPERGDGGTLVAAFFYQKSWHAWIDDREVTPAMNALGMMQIPVKPGDRTVLFRFQGLTAWDFIFSFLCSVTILLIAHFAPLLRNKSK